MPNWGSIDATAQNPAATIQNCVSSMASDTATNSSRRSGCRAGDGTEQSVGADIGHQQCAGQLAQNGHDEIHQTLGDAA